MDYEEELDACQRKKRYRSPEAAGQAADRAHANGSEDRLRVYPCMICEGFHLTHISLEDRIEER